VRRRAVFRTIMAGFAVGDSARAVPGERAYFIDRVVGPMLALVVLPALFLAQTKAVNIREDIDDVAQAIAHFEARLATCKAKFCFKACRKYICSHDPLTRGRITSCFFVGRGDENIF
jgi:hypothetical protein